MNERIREIALRFFRGDDHGGRGVRTVWISQRKSAGPRADEGVGELLEARPCSAGRRARFARFAEAEDSAAASAAPSVAAYLGCGRGAGARLDARARISFRQKGPNSFLRSRRRRARTAGISLPDGTQVWLNAGSALSYGSSFNETSREVSLSGEAYFEVARHAALPFRVEARGCTFTVLGTKFDISAYAEDPAVTAALLEGALRFESEDKQEAMTPGDLVTYDCATATVRREQVDVRQYRAWIDGVIRYDAITLPSLLQEAGPRVRRGDRPAHAQVRRSRRSASPLFVRPKYQIGHAGAVRTSCPFRSRAKAAAMWWTPCRSDAAAPIQLEPGCRDLASILKLYAFTSTIQTDRRIGRGAVADPVDPCAGHYQVGFGAFP